ncbi:hypothetical protein [Streptomyces sp. NPDC048636]|uniref:hypothetical protein n=1 Tax=Streptomyces sp. NPDC048636 TaxID=3155762 RepID=UPI0034134A12
MGEVVATAVHPDEIAAVLLAPLMASVPHSLFGLGCAVLTTVAALGETVRHGAGAALAGAAVIALTLSMGATERLLHRCRGHALATLARGTTLRRPRWRTGRALSTCPAVRR